MKPIIGIAPRVMTYANNYKVQVNVTYLTPFNKRNINAIILPLNSPNIEDLLPLCDGFLLPGGDDIDPKWYNETNDEGLSKDIDPLLDEIDNAILQYAVKNKVPTLGICRGIQSLSAFLGGSLHQDIEHDNLQHEFEDHKHMVTTLDNTVLSHLFPKEFLINSYHHQVVKDLPDGFEVTHRYQGVIEGIAHKTLPIFGVQWHPERFEANESEIIFDYFVTLINKYHKEKTGD